MQKKQDTYIIVMEILCDALGAFVNNNDSPLIIQGQNIGRPQTRQSIADASGSSAPTPLYHVTLIFVFKAAQSNAWLVVFLLPRAAIFTSTKP